MNTKAVRLPQIEPYEADYEKMEIVINQIRSSKVCLTMLETKDGEFKLLFSDFGMNEFIMIMKLLDKNEQLFAFIKAAVVNTELYRIDEEEALKYSDTTLEYIKMGKFS